MFKRILKIILILIAVFLLIIGILWLISRHKAEKSGASVLSFKEFVGLGSKEGNAGNNVGTLSSIFGGSGANGNGLGGNGNGNSGANGNGLGGNGNAGNGLGGDGGNGIGDNANVSTFTDDGFSPTGADNGLGNGGISTGNTTNGNGNGTNGSGSGNSTGGTTTGSGGNSTTGGDTTSAPLCGTQDTTITFTADQLAKLTALQNRFYALAATLHTDADVQAEVANHDAFALRADQITELYNYCESKLPLITDPHLQARVATPFWDAWNATDGNEFWDTTGAPQASGPTEKDSVTFLDFVNSPTTDLGTQNYLTQVHDNKNSDTSPKDYSGISGPYGEYNFYDPEVVLVNGSIMKPPAVLLMPVIEHILRINLW